MDRSQAMGNGSRLESRVWLTSFGFTLAACSVASDVSLPPLSSATPIDSGATVSGPAGFGVDRDAGIGSGDDSLIAEFAGESGQASVPAGGAASGGTDSGGASSENVAGDGGAISNKGGVAATGGSGHGGSAGSAGAASHPPATLFFSEYVEGSSSNKALEITARANSVLDGCKVGAYFNGSSEASVIASLSGNLDAGQTLTLCTSTLQTKLGAVCNQVGRLTFNGNDAVAISCDGNILDVIGQIGVDPGAAWGSGSVSTADHTLRRKCSVTVGDGDGLDAFDPGTEWQALPADTFSGLGSRGC